MTLGLAVTSSLALSDQELNLGIDGLRCDSCGMECSTVCGSRAFRTCCFNYIKKKRSGGSDEDRMRGSRGGGGKLRRGSGSNGYWVTAGEYFEPQMQVEGPWAWFYPQQPPMHQPPTSGGDDVEHGRNSRTTV